MLGFAALGAMSTGGAGATKPDDEGEHKVWVCHVVEGQGELKNGYNLIEVDVAAVETEGHLNHVSNDGLRRDIIPAPYGAAVAVHHAGAAGARRRWRRNGSGRHPTARSKAWCRPAR